MNKLKEIFLYLANKLGLELAEKVVQTNDFYESEKISLTAAVSERIAKTTLVGSKMVVEGTSARADAIQNVANLLYLNYLRKSIAFALGTGSALIKPNTDGERFGFDVISQDNYYITDEIGGFIKSIQMVADQYTTDNNEYTLVESQEIKQDAEGTPYISIEYTTFKNNKPVEKSQTKWETYEDKNIPNVDRVLVGRIVCPTLNRSDVNSKYGVPITYGLTEVIENAKDNYRQCNQERKDKETLIFADKNILIPDENGFMRLPKGKERILMAIRNRGGDGKMIDTYSPEIRDQSLDNELERNLRMFELLAGLGEGVLSKSTATYTNIDQVRDLKEATYSYMVSIRNSVDDCINNLLYAINILMNYNQNTPDGEYDAHIEWSDQYMSSVTQRFSQYAQADSMGWIEAAEGRAMMLNEDIDEARERIAEIKSQEPERIDLGGDKE